MRRGAISRVGGRTTFTPGIAFRADGRVVGSSNG